jgi:hypothetical protein
MKNPPNRKQLDKNTLRTEQEIPRGDRLIKTATEFRGSADLELPTMADKTKFMAFLKICDELRALSGGILRNPIRFTGSQMIREMGVAQTGKIYQEIAEWGLRMAATRIVSEVNISDKTTKKKVHRIESKVFTTFERKDISVDGGKEEGFEVVLEDWLLDDINRKNVRHV